MLRLKQTLGGAALILSSRLLEASEHIQSLQRGYYFSLRPQRPIETILGSIVAMSPQALEQRQAIRAAFSSGRIHRSLGIPPPGVHESSEPEGDDSSSDMEQSDTTSVVILSHKTSGHQDEKAPPRTDDPATDTEETDADPSHTTSRNIDGQNHKGEDEEDSRYASTRFRATAATGTSTPPGRRTLNRFNPLSDLKVEYVITSSEESDASTDGSKGAPLAHANKKRQLDTELTKDSRRASRRKYWAGKAQLENADQSIV
ncbi:hypothetical protein FRB91_000861 [Serendipita sp. 411]|nr:hypothetical protein FRB91_000861 [Serendipita sp. 411]